MCAREAANDVAIAHRSVPDHEPAAKTPPEFDEIVGANNAVGFKLIAACGGDENVVLSPMGIATALQLACLGARGETKQEMSDVLGLGRLTDDAICSANSTLRTRLVKADPKVIVNIADSVWLNQGFALKPEYQRMARTSFGSEVREVDFGHPERAARVINGWVADHTGKMITKLFEARDAAGMIMALVSAVYFKGQWARPFDPTFSRDGAFHCSARKVKTVTMMQQSGSFRYLEDEHKQVIALPYGKGSAEMVIVLPREPKAFAALRSRLDMAKLSQLYRGLEYCEVALTLPRFSLEAGLSLGKCLARMGMKRAFAQADFGGITEGPLQISEVMHQVKLDVNEEGTVAAAATSVSLIRGFDPFVRRFAMTVDRPFFVAIRDTVTGQVLFMGYVIEP